MSRSSGPQSIGRLFQRAARAHADRFFEKLAERGHADLTLFHTALITNLDEEGTRITALAERAGMSKQSMSQLVRELEDRRYVKRTRDPSDKRAFLIQFTELGEQLLDDARSAKRAVEAEYAAFLGEEEVAHLNELLQTLVDQIG